MDSQPTNYFPLGAYVGLVPTDQVPSLEAQLARFHQTYCRDLVREGRLDWDGFDIEAGVAGDHASNPDQPATGHTPEIERRSSRQPRWGRTRRRLSGGRTGV